MKRIISGYTFIIVFVLIIAGLSILVQCKQSKPLANFEDLMSVVKEIKNDVNDLRSNVDKFRDGNTNWREIVPKVESVTFRIESRLSKLESYINQCWARYL